MKLKLLISIHKAWSNTKGFSLIEVLLSSFLFALLVTAFVGAYIYGQDSTSTAGRRARAAYIAQEGLEAVRSIRDSAFSNLVDGTYGLVISSNQWILSGSSDITDIFTRQVTISTVDANRKQVSCNVNWRQNPQRMGNISLVTYLTNWQAPVSLNDCNSYCTGLGFGYTEGACVVDIPSCSASGGTNEPGGNQYCTVGNLNTCCCSAVPPADTISPSNITNLALSNPTTNSIILSWTSPGDDGNVGTATSYDIRYSTSLITEVNWVSATQVTGEPTPLIVGSNQSMTVSGLNPSTTYYFAMKTSDEVPNTSAISNVPSLATTSAITTCAQYCQSLLYSNGTCRGNSNQCKSNGQTYQSGGNQYCTGGSNADTCCCTP